MKNVLAAMIMTLLSACHAAPGEAAYPFALAPTGEAAFFGACIKSNQACRWLRVTQRRDGSGLQSVDAYAFPAGEEVAPVSIRALCKNVMKLTASISDSSRSGIKKIDYEKTADPALGLCKLSVPGLHKGAGHSGFNYVRIERNVSAGSDATGSNALYLFAGMAKNKVIVQSGVDSRLYLETNLGAGNQRGTQEIGGGDGVVVEFDSKDNDYRYVAVSSRHNWDGMIDIYKAKAGAMGGGQHSMASLASAMQDYARLHLAYAVDGDNFGPVPRLDYAEVVRRQRGDCKDLAVVMMRKLADHGIRATPVLIGISNGLAVSPTMRNLPDFIWANHVILFLPDFNRYLDATLPSMAYLVDRNYRWYGAVGINLATNGKIIVGGG